MVLHLHVSDEDVEQVLGAIAAIPDSQRWKVEVAQTPPQGMRRIALILVTLVVLLPLNVQAGAPVAVDDGAVFGSHGGAVSSANSSAVALEDLNPVLEDYTATWCTNCVDVEHALEDLVAERGGHIFAFHRSIGETEDPSAATPLMSAGSSATTAARRPRWSSTARPTSLEACPKATASGRLSRSGQSEPRYASRRHQRLFVDDRAKRQHDGHLGREPATEQRLERAPCSA